MAQDPKARRDEILNETISDLTAVLEALRSQVGSPACWGSVADASRDQEQILEVADRVLKRRRRTA